MRYKIYEKKNENNSKFLADGFSCGEITYAAAGYDLALMPGYRHYFTVTGGECVCVLGGDSTEKICQGEKRSFAGTEAVKLMGSFNGYYVTLQEDYGIEFSLDQLTGDRTDIKVDGSASAAGVYCADGYAVVAWDESTVMLEPGAQAVFYGDPGELSGIGVMGEGNTVVFTVCAGSDSKECTGTDSDDEDVKKEDDPEKGHKEQDGSFSLQDLGYALLISLTNFRAARYITSFRKRNWLDDELFRAIRSITSKHISAVLWVILFIAECAAVGHTFGFANLVIAGIATAVADIVVIMPVIFALKLPKPIKDHIKAVSEMTEEEKLIQDRRDHEVMHKKRALKRY